MMESDHSDSHLKTVVHAMNAAYLILHEPALSLEQCDELIAAAKCLLEGPEILTDQEMALLLRKEGIR